MRLFVSAHTFNHPARERRASLALPPERGAGPKCAFVRNDGVSALERNSDSSRVQQGGTGQTLSGVRYLPSSGKPGGGGAFILFIRPEIINHQQWSKFLKEKKNPDVGGAWQ